MTTRFLRIALLTCLLAGVPAGCSSLHAAHLQMGGANNSAPKPIDPQQVQATTMNFAERYLIAMADTCDRLQTRSSAPDFQRVVLQTRLLAGTGAMGNAVDPNPIVGLMDMAVMVTLTRESMGDPSIVQILGPENSALLVETLAKQETNVWSLVGDYLTADQVAQLRAVAQRWRQEHPQQVFVGGARLADFPEAQTANDPGAQMAANIFKLVSLDPFTGLDPAVRQVEESRILAERMFFYLQNMPTLLSWQTDMLYLQMLTQPQVAQLFKDTATVSANTTGFTQATTRFADASSDFAKSIETFRKELPEQQATLVKQVNDLVGTQLEVSLKSANSDIATLRDATVVQLNDLVATQREGALKQAATEIAAQRDAAITQLDTAVKTQQELMATNLRAILDTSTERLYQRARTLILIAAAALLAVLIAHRILIRRWPAHPARP